MTEKWTSEETRVYFGEGGIDLCNAPDPPDREQVKCL